MTPRPRSASRAVRRAALLAIAWCALDACGAERRSVDALLPEGGVLYFDGAMIPSDDAGAPRDLGTPDLHDAGPPDAGIGTGGPGAPCVASSACRSDLVCVGGACTAPAGEGEFCASEAACMSGLECIASRCVAVGGSGEACPRTGTCDAGLMCVGLVCRETVQVRFCHCIYTTTTRTPVVMDLRVGDVLIGPTPANLCSPCQSVPLGTGVPYVIRETATESVYGSGTMTLSGAIPEMAVTFAGAGVTDVVVADCRAGVTGFCSF